MNQNYDIHPVYDNDDGDERRLIAGFPQYEMDVLMRVYDRTLHPHRRLREQERSDRHGRYIRLYEDPRDHSSPHKDRSVYRLFMKAYPDIYSSRQRFMDPDMISGPRDIPGFDGYSVDSSGTVRNQYGHILRPCGSPNQKGYVSIKYELRKDGKRYAKTLWWIMKAAFGLKDKRDMPFVQFAYDSRQSISW